MSFTELCEAILVLQCTLPRSNNSKIIKSMDSWTARDGGVVNGQDDNSNTDSIESNSCLTHDNSAALEAVTNSLHSAGDAAFSNCVDKNRTFSARPTTLCA